MSDVDVRVMAVMIVGAVAVVAGLPSRLHTGPGLHVFVDIRRLSSTAPHHLTVTYLLYAGFATPNPAYRHG